MFGCTVSVWAFRLSIAIHKISTYLSVASSNCKLRAEKATSKVISGKSQSSGQEYEYPILDSTKTQRSDTEAPGL